MFVFEYKYSDYQLLMEDMARQLGVSIVNNVLHFPEDIARGYYRFVSLPNGLQVNLINCTFNCDWYLHRKRSEKEFYTLRFDEFTIPGSLVISIDDQKQSEVNTTKSLVYLTSSVFDMSYLGSRGTIARGIHILIQPEWLCQFLGIDDINELLKKYLELKAESYTIAAVDTEYATLMDDILTKQPSDPFANLFIMNRVQFFIEKFFSRLHSRLLENRLAFRMEANDINRILHSEMLLTLDFTQKPMSIDQLARICMMSPSKFKTSFRAIFGKPVYTHYQQKRLEWAQMLLLSGKYNVTETASQVAYDNTSNFIAAYRRQFKVSPGEVLNR